MRISFFLGEKVMESEEFMLLPVNQLIEITGSDELNVRSEEQVYSSVISWVKYNIPERRSELSKASTSRVGSWPSFMALHLLCERQISALAL